MTNTRAKFPLAWILLILAGSLLLRINALWMPHWRGDQAQYVILSMKLTHFGLDGYNLRRAALGAAGIDSPLPHPIQLTVVKPTETDVPGGYLEMMKGIGQAYYDEPLHMRAPLLPAILALSHRLIAGANQPFMVMSYGFTWADPVLRFWPVWSRQLWAVGVPLFFNLGVIALAAYLAWNIFGSRRIAVYASALLASNPLSIWLAHRILTEDPTAFWITASFTVLAVFRSRLGVLPSVLAGLFAGLTVLTNQRAGLMVVAAGLFVLITIWHDRAAEKPLIRRLFLLPVRCAAHPFFWAYAATFLLITGFWFLRVIQVYGEPLHQPNAGLALANVQDTTGWFAAVRSRPQGSVLFAVGTLLLSPLFGLAYLTWNKFWRAVRNVDTHSSARGVIILWLWILVFYLYLAEISYIFAPGNKEHRYFYPAYPAIAVLAAAGLDGVRQKLAARPGRERVADVLVILLLFVNLAWGCALAYPKIIGDQLLF